MQRELTAITKLLLDFQIFLHTEKVTFGLFSVMADGTHSRVVKTKEVRFITEVNC